MLSFGVCGQVKGFIHLITNYSSFSRRLYLSDNLISDVGRGTFAAITRIGTIDLARNQLKKIDFQMFAQLNYVEVMFELSHCIKYYFIKK